MTTTSSSPAEPGGAFSDPTRLAPEHALKFVIGTYVQVYSQVEYMVAVIAALIMEQDLRTVQFLWQDVGLKIKTKGTRRAASETFGKDDRRYIALHGLLTALEKRSEFRNHLLHGTFVTSATAGQTLGRPGRSLQNMFAQFEPIDASNMIAETAELQSLFRGLTEYLSANFTGRTPS